MNMRKADFIGALALLALVVFGLYQTSLIDLALSSELETFTGPRAYPRFLLYVMLFLVVIQLGKLWFHRGTAVAESSSPMHPRLTKVLLGLLLLILFTAVFESLGYLVTIIPLLIAIGYLNGADNIYVTCIFAFFVSVVCLVVFRYGLNTVLPEGVFGIDQIF